MKRNDWVQFAKAICWGQKPIAFIFGLARHTRHKNRSIVLILLSILTTLLCIVMPGLMSRGLTIESSSHESSSQTILLSQSRDLEQQAQQHYERGEHEQAIVILQQVIQEYESQRDTLRQAIALSNLALVYQQLGAWTEANQAIDTSLSLLEAETTPPVNASVLAQVLNVQGGLQLAQGQAQAALLTWERSTALFEQTGDATAITTTLNQAEALQELGLYRQAIALLITLNQTLQPQPDSLLKVTALRSLGDAMLVVGNLPQAREQLQQSLTIAEQLPETSQVQDAIAATLLSLGNLTRAEAIATLSLNDLTPTEAINRLNTPPPGDLNPTQLAIVRSQTETAQAFYQQMELALSLYQRAIDTAPSANTRIQAKLNQFRLLVETERREPAQTLYGDLQAELSNLPLSRDSIYNRIDLAQSLVKLGDRESDVAQLLATANQQAQSIGDIRAQSYALGNLGGLYEQAGKLSDAQSLTQQALLLSQSIDATDISYLWQWQLGRLLNAQQETKGAIAAYQEAVNSLQALRNDLVAVNRDVQFSFREKVEPVYRGLVDLLLRPGIVETNSDSLTNARDVIEGLQIAELDNFFREACLDTEFQLDSVVDQENLSAAIFYTIVLPNRIEVILKLPQRPLLHYTADVLQQTVETTVDNLLIELRRPFASRVLTALSQQMYDWLIRPAEPFLQGNSVDTLVFVLDGALRSVPMAALYDGQNYLSERYSVAVAPGLQLPDPQPLQQQDLQALVVGLSESRDNFPPLRYVAQEVEQIQADVSSQVLFNQSFTRENFQELVSSIPFSIVHIATHGQFSSNAADTFILAWDERINVNDLSSLLQTQELTSPNPIELLVLSACQTAVGDRRATLGLAGVAVRAGARSTIASLWNLDDDSGAVFMGKFYEELLNNPISKAEALRRAQVALLNDPQYQSPRFWAPYVLLGNWL
ncbi:MAG: CHAT domain-containing protein [Cyanobacteria bacterium CRU_2_1]|nr:CHAT domain-containing protein [Cyanobacteria bacterium RU_5_0]NJR58155.1 CHAT domain-containing protein [Cyanobacteria bacterium CRU_2_1]